VYINLFAVKIRGMKPIPFTISAGFAQLELHKQIDFLVDLIRKQEQVIRQQEKHLDELRHENQKQAVKIEQLDSEIRRLKKIKKQTEASFK
jgi:phage shock protein A